MTRRLLASLSSMGLAFGIVMGANSVPAGALTGTEKFVMAVHEDFLLREPSSAEMTLWTTYLGSNSRAAMVSSLLGGNEFKTLWVLGASQYYLGGTSSQLSTVTSNLISSGDFVASEVALLAGSLYFSQHGSTNSGYVSALYEDVLLRPADPSGLSYWSGRLNAGTSTRSGVANYLIRATESATRRVAGTAGMVNCPSTVLTDVSSIPSGSYCIVLDRVADASGTTYWSGQLAGTSQLPSLWSSLAGSAEYYNKAQLRF